MDRPKEDADVYTREEIVPLRSLRDTEGEEKDTDEGKDLDEDDEKEALTKEKNKDSDDDEDEGMDEAEKRGIWDTKCDYVMSLMGYAVGLGNIWRFPYLCYKNGGGAFLVPYFLMLVFVGFPLFLLEVSMSQFCSQGGLTIYSVCPALLGSGFASIITNIIVHSYYSLILTYPLMFIYYSFAREVPWGHCDNPWNTDNCYLVASVNATDKDDTKQLVSSADEFFHLNILDITSGIGENGTVVWKVLGTNILVWLIVFLCIFKGIKITGKVVWFTATFPILMLLILLVRGSTLPGAGAGIYYYLYPDFEKLKDGQVWAAAATQIFYSLGPGWSAVITMGSYNKFNNNCLKDAIILPLLNCSASILAGFVVFSVLGFMAHEMGTTVDKVTAAGPALVFVTYPEALSMMPMPSLWSILFFLMVFFVGLDSLFVSVETSIASLIDRFPKLRQWRFGVTVVIIVSMFLLCLACSFQGGMYVLQLMDWYASALSLLCVCICEVFIFSFSYGVGNTIRDIQMMTKKHVNYFWYICLLFVTPTLMVLVFLNQIMNFAPASYRNVVFPPWAQAAGWALTILPASMIPICIVVYICRAKGSFIERLRSGFSYNTDWGPLSLRTRAMWEEYCLENPLRHRLLHPDFKAPSHERKPLSGANHDAAYV